MLVGLVVVGDGQLVKPAVLNKGTFVLLFLSGELLVGKDKALRLPLRGSEESLRDLGLEVQGKGRNELFI